MAVLQTTEVCAFFLKAMMQGYASGGTQKVTVSELPGHKAISYRDGDFYLLDRWTKTPDSKKSAGTTTIWHQDVPVWVVNYGGSYRDEEIPLLKLALRYNYERGVFRGGRGPCIFHDEGATPRFYMNRPLSYDFSGFRGREEILNWDGGLLGYHDYWGMSLL